METDAPDERPAVSVVLPTYQRRELARRAVQSVLDQTFTDFELLVIDDGGNDATGEALQGLDPRLRYLWQENRGVSAARNAGIRLARGELVAFLDSDNTWLPDHLAVLVEMLTRHPHAVAACTCPGYRLRGRRGPGEAEVVDILARVVLHNPLGYVSCVGVRRPVLVAAGGFDERLAVYEDGDLWPRLALAGPFVLLPRRTIVHARSPESLFERGRRTGILLDAMERAARRAVEELGRAAPGRHELEPAARAVVELLAGLRLLAAGDGEGARACLAAACELWPGLSRDVEPVIARIRQAVGSGAELAETLRTVAELWPDPAADTPLFLRAYAGALLLRGGRPGRALAVLATRAALRNPAFAARTLPVGARRARLWLDEVGERRQV